MTTITVLIIIWFLFSLWKTTVEDNLDNYFYAAGVTIGLVAIVFVIIVTMLKYLPWTPT